MTDSQQPTFKSLDDVLARRVLEDRARVEAAGDRLAAARDSAAGDLRYSVAEEDGMFVATWLDGEVTSDGATEADAIAHLHEAVSLFLER